MKKTSRRAKRSVATQAHTPLERSSPRHHGFRGIFVMDLSLFKPTVGKITFALVLMVVLFLLLLIDLPEAINNAVLYLIAWPLFLVTTPCGVEKACLQPASFAGVVLMLLYWYVTASLFEGIRSIKSEKA